MNYKSIGIIGPGNHFKKNIKPILKKNKQLRIEGYLTGKKKNEKLHLSEKVFFKNKFDFVYISCPNQLHEKYVIKSLKSGYNVICEKPFVTSSKNIDKIINLSIKKKRLIFECFMFAHHPVFHSIRNIIKKKILGEIRYVISNFKFPSQDKKNNRYFKKLGNGYFYDSAVYPISLENYLFKFKHKSKVFTEIIKEQVDLRGYTILFNKNVKRIYFWGEGQNYSNNLEIFFNKGSLYVDKFYSKKFKEKIFLKIDNKGKSILKVFKNIDHFEEMFKKIFKNYKKKSFMVKSRNLVRNQSKLLDFIKSA